jgi:acyl dehydratase
MKIGQVLAPLRKGPLTSSHIVRWCAAQQNWDKIHYDRTYAMEYAGLPERLINGALKQHLLSQFLLNAFNGGGWIWRVGFRFLAPDFVGEALEVRGTIRDLVVYEGRHFVDVELGIWNTNQGRNNTTASAVVIFGPNFEPKYELGEIPLPPRSALSKADCDSDPGVPEEISKFVGSVVEKLTSAYPLDLSRLRLFAEAIGDLHPMNFDFVAGERGPYGVVTAPHLFPIHSIELVPGTLPLSDEETAMGREGVSEIGRNLGARFGLSTNGMLNGGSQIEIQSLLRLGETVCAECKLVGAVTRRGTNGREMLILEALNEFRTTSGRPLLLERQVTVFRHLDVPGNQRPSEHVLVKDFK